MTLRELLENSNLSFQIIARKIWEDKRFLYKRNDQLWLMHQNLNIRYHEPWNPDVWDLRAADWDIYTAGFDFTVAAYFLEKGHIIKRKDKAFDLRKKQNSIITDCGTHWTPNFSDVTATDWVILRAVIFGEDVIL